LKRRQFLTLGSGLLVAASPVYFVLANGQHNQLRTGFVFDQIYLEHWLEPGHPESPQRLKRIMALMEKTGLLNKVVKLSPLSDVLPYVYQIHTQDHVRNMQSQYGHSHDVAIAAVGGTLAAVQAVCQGRIRNAFCAIRPPGHHARNSGREEGFCFYNNVAVAARYAQQVFHLEKILIIDWDYHHGNGTEALFYTDPSVLYFSTHDFYAYPGTGDPARTGEGPGNGYNINVHLDCGATDEDIINAYKEKLLPAAHQFKPDMILISAGFDSRKDDILGCFRITDEGFIALTKIIMMLADEYCNGSIVSVLEGGYNLDGLASAVIAHVRTLLAA